MKPVVRQVVLLGRSHRDLVINGTFDSDINGWLLSNGNVSAEVVAGQAKVTQNGGVGWFYQAINVKIGKLYEIVFDFVSKQGSGGLRVGNSIGATTYFTWGGTGTKSLTFTPTQAVVYVAMGDSAAGSGTENVFDNISIRG